MERNKEALGAAGRATAPISKIEWRNEMNKLQKKSLRMCSVGTMFLLGLLAFGATSEPALGQETVQGKFTLPVEARLGKTVLSAGDYKFSVVPLGTLWSVDSIQAVNSHVLVVVWGSVKGGPITSLVATASKPADILNPKMLDFRVDAAGVTIHSMCLEKNGLMLEFNQYKPENELRARGPELPQGHGSAKGKE
jgi:hypothetical protein